MADPQQHEFFGVRVARQVRLTIPLTAVESVVRVPPRQICPVPGVSPNVLGVVNRAGVLIWVFDLSRFLQMPASEDEDPPSLGVILKSTRWTETGSRQIKRLACLVSQLEGIFALPPQPLHPLPNQLPASLRQVFKGMGARPIAPPEPIDLETESDPQTVPSQDLSTPEWVRAAVLDPEALFDALYGESDLALAHLSPGSQTPIASSV